MTSRPASCRIAASLASRVWADRQAPPSLLLLFLHLGILFAPAGALPCLADTVHLRGGRILHLRSCQPDGAELRCSYSGGVIGIPLEQVESFQKDLAPSAPTPPMTRPPAPTPSRLERTPAATPRPAEPIPPVLEGSERLDGAAAEAAARARIEALTAALAADPAGNPGAHHELAVLHASLGNAAMIAHDYEGAVTRYNAALDHDPRLLVASLNLGTALIDLGRHEEAESLLRSLLSQDPDNARALDLLGEVAMQTGRTDEAIELWRKSLAIRPTESLQSRLERAGRLKQAEEGFERSEGAHFSLKFDTHQASNALAEEILSSLEESFSDLSTRFAHTPSGIIRVTLYSQQAFREATASPDWVGGLFDGQLRVPIGGLSRLTPQLAHVLVHELTHCFVTSKSHANAPQWVQEGIAQVIEGKSALSSRSALRESFEVLGPAGSREFSYLRALSQVEFFLHTWSDSHFNDLLDRLGRGNDIESAMRAVTGLSYDEFIKAWGESLAD